MDSEETERWEKTRSLTAGAVATALVAGAILAFIAAAAPAAAGFPLARILALAALPLVLAAVIFLFANRQDAVDRRAGYRGDGAGWR